MIPRPVPAFLCAALSAVGLAGHVTACSRTLTAVQAEQARAMVGPNCTAIGTDVQAVPVVGGIAGMIVALLCAPVADDIIASETILTDGGVGAPARSLTVSAGCAPVPVPGDALGQWACPELHGRVLAAGAKRMAARKAPGR